MKSKDISLTGRRVPPGDRPPPGFRKRDDMTFQMGVIRLVNVEKMTMTIQLFDRRGTSFNIPISQPYAGPGSYIASTPEVGSIVLLAVQENLTLPIMYLPNYATALNPSHVQLWPDNVDIFSDNDYFYRMPQLRKGEVGLGSSGGVDILLNDNFSIENCLGDKYEIRKSDMSSILTARNSYIFNSGIWHNSGIIYRNSLGKVNTGDGQFAHKLPLEDGRVLFPLKFSGTELDGEFFTEYLIEAEEISSADVPSNDVNQSKNIGARVPIAVFSLGNFAGNNPYKRRTYGKLLGVRLFNDGFAEDGAFDLRALSNEDPEKYGMAVTLYKPEKRNYETGAFFGIDKEGHFYQYMPAASGGGLGRGRSMSILAQGNKKEVWGQESQYGNSWDMVTDGGIRWVVGRHNDRDSNYKNRSIDVRTSSSVYFQFGEDVDTPIYDFDSLSSKSPQEITDFRKFSKIERQDGAERTEIAANREAIVGGSDKLRITGMKEVKIAGSNTIDVGNGMNVTIGDVYAVKVTKECQESFGSRVTTITSGSSELVIDPKPNPARGDIIERIKSVRGNRQLTIEKSGNIEETINGRGNREFSTRNGNFSADIATRGDITLKTGSGKIVYETGTGSVEIKGRQKILLQTTAKVELDGSTVELKGSGGLLSGVITQKSHFDYVTGAPLQPSRTVKATL
jgi:hypothetical protein